MPDSDDVAARLATRYGDDAWIGACVRVVGSARQGRSGAIGRTPDHYLAAAWAPGAPRSRWPDAVVIGSPAADNALAALLRHVPADARLFLADLDAVDAALAARILLAADRNLEPCQREGIAAFVAAEEARVAARVAADYTDRDDGFERFRAQVLDAPRAAR
ncbi:hypothetical protein BURK1_03069 [Burkholderiales bacterium]|nr:hypothetical protein BURK1_03069 [Burkholderiales bacterium]